MGKIKSLIKRVAPSSLVHQLNTMKAMASNSTVFSNDKKRFKKYYSNGKYDSNESQINAKIIFFNHSIEKGLSHNNLRLGFGKNALKELANVIKIHDDNSYDKSDKAYICTLSVLKEYIKIHEQNKYDLSYLDTLFSSEFLISVRRCDSSIGGATLIKKERNNTQRNFKELFLSRSSIRTYSNEAVDINKINEAIKISTKSPSVCNRQSSRVYVITNHKIIKDALSIQAGMNGHPMPPALIVVTSDLNCFVSLAERNQPYIDGGVFSMSLLLALEYKGLAACPLNAMFSQKREEDMRKIVVIGESENIIMLISVGNSNTSNKIAKSFRYNIEHIMKHIE